jgi:threonine dehydratase
MAPEPGPVVPVDASVAVTREDVAAARARLGDRVRRTPVIWVGADQLASSHAGFWLKLESLQVTGAFKARGALNSLLADDVPEAGVCAASGGNHGQAVAWAARMCGTPATVFVPTTCPPIKLRRLEEYGATVQIVGDVGGAGTVTAELIEQIPQLDTLLVPVGGGGLLAGALAALDGTPTRVVAIEPLSARCLGAALDAGRPVDVTVSGPAVDSLGPRRVGQIGFEAARAHGVEHVDVDDDAIKNAQRAAWQELRIGLEGGGATALAAILYGGYRPQPDESTAVLSCGGNVDLNETSGSPSGHRWNSKATK